eukprot:Phypoly_transcript_09308.p1 GENE.Phypoly_transcript_09308~~Phypoly_transcript_09308.p1  ORF type:complete len:218 (+),score=49.06 Phypoly_transcript_09308:59-712(+)
MMTLPNRANYIVERKAEGGDNVYQKQEVTPPPTYTQTSSGFPFQPPETKHTPETTKSPHDSNDQDARAGNKAAGNGAASPSATTNSNSYDSYRTNSVDRLSVEDIQEKKNYVQKHRLQQHMLQIVEYCRNEGIIPNLPPNLYTPPQQQTDYSLNEFLETQGIECPEDDAVVSKEDDEFTFKLVQLKSAYNEELEKLNRVCNDFITKLQAVLQDQAKV